MHTHFIRYMADLKYSLHHQEEIHSSIIYIRALLKALVCICIPNDLIRHIRTVDVASFFYLD